MRNMNYNYLNLERNTILQEARIKIVSYNEEELEGMSTMEKALKIAELIGSLSYITNYLR